MWKYGADTVAAGCLGMCAELHPPLGPPGIEVKYRSAILEAGLAVHLGSSARGRPRIWIASNCQVGSRGRSFMPSAICKTGGGYRYLALS